ncbi:MAG: DNA-binding protein [Acidobacteria bacterium]|nr:MAG: DNA-binding protein [Acidobacteriota bacterium]
MHMAAIAQHPITLPKDEQNRVEELETMLSKGRAALVSCTGERIDLPNTVYNILTKVVTLMAHGQAITLIPDNQAVTTQRAADILGVSRPFFVKLLETGAMAYHRVGNQRRVYLRDVLAYAQKRDEERQAALDRLSRAAVEAGLYDRNKFPEGGRDE